jgi:hypothetical protein
MITLILDKFTLVKVSFSIRVPIHQGFKRSTQGQMTHPRGFTTPPPQMHPKAMPTYTV